MESGHQSIRSAQKNQRYEQILSAAFGQFCQSGFSDTRIEDIAQQLALSKGTVYLYFRSKEQLFAAMLDHATQPLQHQLLSYRLSADSSQERLRQLLDFLFKLLVEDRHNRELFRLLIAEAARFPSLIAQQQQKLLHPIQKLVNDLISSTQARPGQRASTGSLLSHVLLAPIVGVMVYQWISGQPQIAAKDDILALYLDSMAHGLMLPRPQAP